MDRKTLISTLSKQLSRDSKEITSLLDGFICVLKDNLSNLDTIAIPSFGEFTANKVEEDVRFDDETNKQILYPPHIKISFKPSTILKKRIN